MLLFFFFYTSAEDENETKHLEALEGAEKRLLLFQIDLLDYPSILAAINGCTGVFHLASPCIVDEVREPEVGFAFLLSFPHIRVKKFNLKKSIFFSFQMLIEGASGPGNQRND